MFVPVFGGWAIFVYIFRPANRSHLGKLVLAYPSSVSAQEAQTDWHGSIIDKAALHAKRPSENVIDQSRLVAIKVASRTIIQAQRSSRPSDWRRQREQDGVEVLDLIVPQIKSVEQTLERSLRIPPSMLADHVLPAPETR